MTAAIQVNAVEKSFGNVQIIRDLNLSVAKGERHAIIGPNGAGKSTTFNLISGHIKPTSGEIRLNGAVTSGCGHSRSTAAGCHARSRSPTCSPA